MTLTERVLAGDRLALARLVTQIENGDPGSEEVLAELYPHTGNSALIGVTGSTGTGKSTLVNQLALFTRQHGWETSDGEPRQVRVAIVAVDPSSPFTGGAILGDRIRMRDLSGDRDVFIRSMASRGALGGLARKTADVVRVLDAAGFEVIIIETVGAGQAEIEIARTAQTTIVIDSPGLGDDIQAIKAGILEIADILVLNKADLPGADNAERALRTALGFARPHSDTSSDEGGWKVPLVKTVATSGDGIAELAEQVWSHQRYLRTTGSLDRRVQTNVQNELEVMLRNRLAAELLDGLPEGSFKELVGKVARRELDPYSAVSQLMERSRA